MKAGPIGLADFDADGYLDLFLPDADGSGVWHGGKDQFYGFNEDGLADLAVAVPGFGNAILLADSAEGFQAFGPGTHALLQRGPSAHVARR